MRWRPAGDLRIPGAPRAVIGGRDGFAAPGQAGAGKEQSSSAQAGEHNQKQDSFVAAPVLSQQFPRRGKKFMALDGILGGQELVALDEGEEQLVRHGRINIDQRDDGNANQRDQQLKK